MALLLVSIVFTGCKTDSARSNLYFHKQALIRYHDSGKYDAEVQRVAGRALNFIRHRATSGETNLAVVLDIDDTALSTWSRLRQDDFARKDTLFVQWASTNPAVAIEPVLNLYRETTRLGIKVFFVTGRREALAERTRQSLKQAGYAGADDVIFRPLSDKATAAVPFKSATRRQIAGQGFRIIANIGDQESDLAGGYAERAFKLPNPFYYTP